MIQTSSSTVQDSHAPFTVIATRQTVKPSVPVNRPLRRGHHTFTRPVVRGKFLFVEDEKFYIKGVTYGPFRPEADGCEYHTPEQVERDFAQMAGMGLNAVRTYTVPPRWLLDIAQKNGLRVMVGLPWEQHITFLDKKKTVQSIERRVREGVRACAGHPAILCFAIGNEIPASIVRWYGRQKVERFLHRLYNAVKAEDPTCLTTYVNFPTTEYLQLPFVDFMSFNVYLETQEKLRSYLGRLQNIAGDRPLVMAEIGLDSMRRGEDLQAQTLDWQIRQVFAGGCAGTFIFAWTDEWHRGGHDILDWAFGVTDRDRKPKPALQAISSAFADTPFPPDRTWPRISVVVCTYNGSRTLHQTLEHLVRLEYPNYEIIVVNDGSKDRTPFIAGEFAVRLINIPNGGLSNARNVGAGAATGEIVAYIDDDAYPDPHWLQYLAHTFSTSKHVAVGGPNLLPLEDGMISQCVAHAPGGPNHVLHTDDTAEHIPGCNLAVRKNAWEAIGGFDPQFRIAGDDVDFCWRLIDRGWTIGFNPAAMVWHHRRHTVQGYLRQQRNYGRAEAMLEVKWPQKYNSFGHIIWRGRLYDKGSTLPLALRRWRVYHGVWGSGLFQSLYTCSPGVVRSLPLMPEWYLVIAALLTLSLAGLIWQPLLLCIPLLVLTIAAPIAQAVMSSDQLTLSRRATSTLDRVKRRVITTMLHMAQPLDRLIGRITFGLTPWRWQGPTRFAMPVVRHAVVWCQSWASPEQRLKDLEASLRKAKVITLRGGTYDRWDLEIRGGPIGAVRIRTAIEEHGSGNQLFRLRAWPKLSRPGVCFLLCVTALAISAVLNSDRAVAALLGVVAMGVMLRGLGDCASATAAFLQAIRPTSEPATPTVVVAQQPPATAADVAVKPA